MPSSAAAASTEARDGSPQSLFGSGARGLAPQPHNVSSEASAQSIGRNEIFSLFGSQIFAWETVLATRAHRPVTDSVAVKRLAAHLFAITVTVKARADSQTLAVATWHMPVALDRPLQPGEARLFQGGAVQEIIPAVNATAREFERFPSADVLRRGGAVELEAHSLNRDFAVPGGSLSVIHAYVMSNDSYDEQLVSRGPSADLALIRGEQELGDLARPIVTLRVARGARMREELIKQNADVDDVSVTAQQAAAILDGGPVQMLLAWTRRDVPAHVSLSTLSETPVSEVVILRSFDGSLPP